MVLFVGESAQPGVVGLVEPGGDPVPEPSEPGPDHGFGVVGVIGLPVFVPPVERTFWASWAGS